MTDLHLINHILGGTTHVLDDSRAEQVLDGLYWRAQVDFDTEREKTLSNVGKPSIVIDDFGFSVRPQQGEFLYLMARAVRAKSAFVNAVSSGAAAIYLAAAIRDNGGGVVFAADTRADNVEATRENLASAGLDQYVELSIAQPAEHIDSLTDQIDIALLDCWSLGVSSPSEARNAIELLEPHLRDGAIVVNENSEPDYISVVRRPGGQFRTSLLPLGVVSVVTRQAGGARDIFEGHEENNTGGDHHGS